MAVKYLDNAGTQYLVNKIKAIDGKIPTESQITTMITTALNTYKEGIVTIVESLPQTGEEGKLYLMVDPSDSDVYIIYTWEDNAFKRMGSKTFTLTVDSALSSTSTNPVQNKVVKSALDGKANSSHTHGSITNDGKLGTASRVVITGTDKKIGISTVTTTELGYLGGVTSAIQTQLNGKSATGHTHTAGDVAGLATVATSGSYNDLSNKPTINDSTITIQKNGTLVGTFTVNGSAKTINIPVPTKTSDLTNDSNFVDTSNSAVSSGITSAKVTSYDSHIADTDIHVTTADKSKWNNGVTQSYVFRYSSTALVASSTNSNALLDNTDNLKVGDKVIDSSGVLFSITAIDTANSTFTIGTALIDLANDSDVVHTSGNETVGGKKTFTDDITASKNATNGALYLQNLSYDPKTNGQSAIDGTKSFAINVLTSTSDLFSSVNFYGASDRTIIRFTARYYTDSQNVDSDSLEYTLYGDGTRSLRPRSNNNTILGESSRKWKAVYATNYYYGSNNVEFSTKFVTTDTAQTISGNKTFSSSTLIYNSDNTANTPNLILQSSKIQLGDTTNSDTQSIVFNAGNSFVAKVDSFKDMSGTQNLQNTVRTRDTSNNVISAMYRLRLFNTGSAFLTSDIDNTIALGSTGIKWKDACTYLINGLTPSSLSLPDLSNSIDISSYITDLTGAPNVYSSPANGYIVLRSTTANVLSIVENTTGMGTYSRGSNQVLAVNLPVVKNSSITIYAICSSLTHAKFIPCKGNV